MTMMTIGVHVALALGGSIGTRSPCPAWIKSALVRQFASASRRGDADALRN